MFRVSLIAALLVAFAANVGHAGSARVGITIIMPERSILYCGNAIRIARENSRATHDLPQCVGFEAYVRAVGADRAAGVEQAATAEVQLRGSIMSPVAGHTTLSMAQADKRQVDGLQLVESVSP